MLLVIGTFRLPPGTITQARPVMAQMVCASRAEAGCIDYSYAEDVLDAGLIHVREMWRDQAALDAHFAMPHLAQWRATWAELGIIDRDLQAYDLGAPRAI